MNEPELFAAMADLRVRTAVLLAEASKLLQIRESGKPLATGMELSPGGIMSLFVKPLAASVSDLLGVK